MAVKYRERIIYISTGNIIVVLCACVKWCLNTKLGGKNFNKYLKHSKNLNKYVKHSSCTIQQFESCRNKSASKLRQYIKQLQTTNTLKHCVRVGSICNFYA